MNYTNREMARRIVADVLTINPPADGQLRMFAVDPETLLGAERVEMARNWAHMVPAGTTLENCDRVISAIAEKLPILTNAAPTPVRLETGHHVPTMRTTH